MCVSCHIRWFPPGPATFDLKHQRPTQKGAYQNQPCEKAEATFGLLIRQLDQFAVFRPQRVQ